MTADMAAKLGGSVGIVFPILSRNRFSLILARPKLQEALCAAYPSDEVAMLWYLGKRWTKKA